MKQFGYLLVIFVVFFLACAGWWLFNAALHLPLPIDYATRNTGALIIGVALVFISKGMPR